MTFERPETDTASKKKFPVGVAALYRCVPFASDDVAF
jgi:hypothetical protein